MSLLNNVVDLPIQTKADTSAASLTTRIYERLRHDILSGALAPGKKLRIDEIREVYGIGASAIREALSLLTSEALVERIDHRGFRVSPISRTGFDELLATRCWLEERALREFDSASATLRGRRRSFLANFHLSRTKHSLAPDRLLENDHWEVRHKALHRALIAACGSMLLLRFCDQMYDLNIRYRRVAAPPRDADRNVEAEHAAIVEFCFEP